METENPFGSVSKKQEETLGYIANFWRLLPQILMSMTQENHSEQLLAVGEGLRSQVYEMMTWFSPTNHDPVSVSDFYKILFLMRDKTLPLVVELEEIADEMGIDLMVPMNENDEVVLVKISEWIPKRLING